MLRTSLAFLLAAFAVTAPAATCVWNAANGQWGTVANWDGCADTAGPSTRIPGADDIAILANGTANLDVSPTVAEFELGANGLLYANAGTQTFEIIHALRLAGGYAKNLLGQNLLYMTLRAGGTGTLLAPTTFENSVFFENSGTLTLGSAGGTALTLLAACELRNMPGGSIAFSGGASRLNLGDSSKLINNAGATLTINGDMIVGRPDAAPSSGTLSNLGTMIVNGPGTLAMLQGNQLGHFEQYGDLTVNNATIACNVQSPTDACTFLLPPTNSNSSITRLNNATLALGGSGVNLQLSEVSTLTGTGTIDAGITVRGTLAPGAAGGPPYGLLAFAGSLAVNPTGTIALDLGGAASYDRLQVGGTASAGYDTSWDGFGRLALHLASGYAPALNEALPVMTYAAFQAGGAFHRIDANYALDYAARFDPTALMVFPAPRLTIDSPSQIEGSGGQTPMAYNLRLSQPTTQTVSVEVRVHDGTAVYGVSPSGDWLLADESVHTFAPGEVVKPHIHPINGDTVVEADESFTVEVLRNKVVNAAIGNGIAGDPFGVGTILTDELAPDTRFVLVGKDNGTSDRKIRRYTTAGVFIDTWDDRMPNALGDIVTGMCFSPSGELLATRFSWPKPILYSHYGAILNEDFGDPVFMSTHESCVFDPAGNVYIGMAGGSSSPDADVPVRKFNRYGELLDTYVLPTGTRGTDWIDLAGDHCTLFYTSEDTSVRRYNVCNHSPLPDLINTLSAPYCYALRLRPNREVLVACQEAVHRVSPDGVNLHTYTRASIGENDPGGLFAMNLDPDNTSFWTAGALSGNVYHVDIESGAVLGSFNSGPGGVAGLAVYDELTHEVVFADGFDPTADGAATLPKFASEPECELEFWPEMREMPQYVPAWMSVVVRDDEDCER
jgi:hypothetical protein